MSACSAVYCTNSSKHYKMYRFPRSKERRLKWLQNCRRGGGWTPTENSRLCEVHFEYTQFERNRADGHIKLKPNAVPTLFDDFPNNNVQRISKLKVGVGMDSLGEQKTNYLTDDNILEIFMSEADIDYFSDEQERNIPASNHDSEGLMIQAGINSVEEQETNYSANNYSLEGLLLEAGKDPYLEQDTKYPTSDYISKGLMSEDEVDSYSEKETDYLKSDYSSEGSMFEIGMDSGLEQETNYSLSDYSSEGLMYTAGFDDYKISSNRKRTYETVKWESHCLD